MNRMNGCIHLSLNWIWRSTLKRKKTWKEIQMREKRMNWIDASDKINFVLNPKCSHLNKSQSNRTQILFKHLLNRWIEWEEISRSLPFNLLRNEYSQPHQTYTRYVFSFSFEFFYSAHFFLFYVMNYIYFIFCRFEHFLLFATHINS